MPFGETGGPLNLMIYACNYPALQSSSKSPQTSFRPDAIFFQISTDQFSPRCADTATALCCCCWRQGFVYQLMLMPQTATVPEIMMFYNFVESRPILKAMSMRDVKRTVRSSLHCWLWFSLGVAPKFGALLLEELFPSYIQPFELSKEFL